MLLPFLIFAFVLVTVFGAYWALVLRPERAKEAAFKQRLTRPKAAKPRLISTAPTFWWTVRFMASLRGPRRMR